MRPNPNSTSATFHPEHNSTQPSSDDASKKDGGENSSDGKSPTMRQKAAQGQKEKPLASQPSTNSSETTRSALPAQSDPEDYESLWRRLDDAKHQALTRNAQQTGSAAMPESKPNYRASHPRDDETQHRPTSRSNAMNIHPGQSTSLNANSITKAQEKPQKSASPNKKSLDNLSGTVSPKDETDVLQTEFVDLLVSSFFGEWTPRHKAAARRDHQGVADLIASGEPLDAMAQDGTTVLGMAIHHRDAEMVKQLLKAGANPMACKKNCESAIAIALQEWPEIAETLVKAIRPGTREHPDEHGNTEIHYAVNHPKILRTLLAAGMRDSENLNGETALIRAAKHGSLRSARHLLSQPLENYPDGDYASYINKVSNGKTAFAAACLEEHVDVAELLAKRGAQLHWTSKQKGLLGFAAQAKNLHLLKLLLARGAADVEPDIVTVLSFAISSGWIHGVREISKFVNVPREFQSQLLVHWERNAQEKMLTAIDGLIDPDKPSIQTLINHPEILKTLLEKHSPDLLVAFLEFFEIRESLKFVIQSLASALISDQGHISQPEMGRALLRFADSRFEQLRFDKETVMRLLQLADQLKDYSLITKIKSWNFPGNALLKKKIPLQSNWISDPVALEFLGLKKYKNNKDNVARFFSKLVSIVNTSDEGPSIDSAQFANDLTLALTSDTIGQEIDQTFEDHRISAVIGQALKPLLEKLVTGLYPQVTDRRESVCRLLIAYTLSNLTENPSFTEHPAIKLMNSQPQWQPMKRKVDEELEAIEQIAATILDTVVSHQLGAKLPETVARLTLDTMDSPNQEAALIDTFRSTLGLLDVPARRLAQACVTAAPLWRASSSSSSTSTTSRATKTSSDFPQTELSQLTFLIGQQLKTLERRPVLDAQLTQDLQNLDISIIDSYQNIVWWQMDMIDQAFSSDNDDSSSVVNSSDDSAEEPEKEKS